MRRLLRPRWVVLHVLVVVAVVVMVSLGFWQLRRLDERRDRNDLVEARLAEPVTAVEELAALDPDDARFRPARVTGAGGGQPVAVRTNQGGQPGSWVFAPVRLDAGPSVAVLLGFAPSPPEEALAGLPAPEADLEVEGVAIPVERLPGTARRAVDDLGVDLDVVVQASAADDPLVPVPTPELDDGPHLAYAGQWFLFASVALVGYPLLVRRRLRDDG